ncbi:MAG: hypothetical protein ACR2ID_03980 [Chthoniobacterales bacterium]
MHLSKRNILQSASFAAVALLLTTTYALCGELWSRAFMGTPASGPFRPFNVVILESVIGDHLRATCSYANYSYENDAPPPVTIRGVEMKDGKFYPHVFAKVTNDVKGEWQTIAELGIAGKRRSRRVAGNSVADRLAAQLDVFRSQIGKFTYGSLVLPTGEPAVFELKDLLPPESASSPKSAITPNEK